MHEVAVNEARKSQRQEQGTGDRVKLPTLGRNLARAVLKRQADAADQEIKQHQFQQAPGQCLGLPKGANHQQTMVDERQIGGQQGQQDQRANLQGLRHASNYRASMLLTACAHRAIRAPGTMPSTSTSRPLTDSTARTSRGADTVVAVTGSSKYMTLTTRR